jgi:hypothetical protein
LNSIVFASVNVVMVSNRVQPTVEETPQISGKRKSYTVVVGKGAGKRPFLGHCHR